MTGGQNRERRAGLDIVVDIHGMRAFAAKTYLQHLLARASLDRDAKEVIVVHGYHSWTALRDMVRKELRSPYIKGGIPAFRTGRRFWCLKSGYLPPAEAACQKCA